MFQLLYSTTTTRKYQKSNFSSKNLTRQIETPTSFCDVLKFFKFHTSGPSLETKIIFSSPKLEIQYVKVTKNYKYPQRKS